MILYSYTPKPMKVSKLVRMGGGVTLLSFMSKSSLSYGFAVLMNKYIVHERK